MTDPEQQQLPTLSFEYDPWRDCATIEGVKYAGGLFRGLGIAPEGSAFRILRRHDGVLTLQAIRENSDEFERTIEGIKQGRLPK